MAKTAKGEKNETNNASILENEAVGANYKDIIAKEADVSVETKLTALYSLQQVDSQVDKIRIIRGELPLEVQDLEDEVAGLETRIDNFVQEINVLETSINERNSAIADCQMLIKRYEEQQNNVRNNREYDSLTKEIEFQNLDITLSEKRIKEFTFTLEAKRIEVETAQTKLTDRKAELDIKKAELDDIIAETEKEESDLIQKSKDNQKFIEERLLTATTVFAKMLAMAWL